MSEHVKIPIKDLKMSDQQALEFIKRMRAVNTLFFLTDGDKESYIISDTKDIPLFEHTITQLIKQERETTDQQFQKVYENLKIHDETMNKVLGAITEINKPQPQQPKEEQKTEPMPEFKSEPIVKPEPVVAEQPEPQKSELLDGQLEIRSFEEKEESKTLLEPHNFICKRCGEVTINIPKNMTDITQVQCPKCRKLIYNKPKRKIPKIAIPIIGVFVFISIVLILLRFQFKVI